jgi:FtsZ-binding cell division protein ZapB
MSIVDGLNLLNEKIIKLLDDFKNLMLQKEDLDKRVSALENENNNLRQERDEIKKRIEELINKIP